MNDERAEWQHKRAAVFHNKTELSFNFRILFCYLAFELMTYVFQYKNDRQVFRLRAITVSYVKF